MFSSQKILSWLFVAIVFSFIVLSYVKEGNDKFINEEPLVFEAPKTNDAEKESEEIVTSQKEGVVPEDLTAENETQETEQKQENEPAVSPLPPLPVLTFSQINTLTRAALVNIVCTTKSAGSFSPSSGSGIVIDPRGIILTNAHIAQYFLLKNHIVEDFVDCTIRTGSPAQSTYKAVPLYISEQWILDNRTNIQEESPTGTGEDDFALLLITSRTNSSSLSLPLPHLSFDELDEPARNESILAAAYPAGFLGGVSIQKDLYITSTIGRIVDIFTFKEATIDLLSLGGILVAQRGSSGGAVVNENGNLIGIIVTSTDGETTEERDARAITLGHINRSLESQTGKILRDLLKENPQNVAGSFLTSTAPDLTQILEEGINN